MKSILISIQPKWCELIASGKKTVEVRKTKPKIETPFKVYIYCTNTKTMGDFILCKSEENVKLFGYNSAIGVNKGFAKNEDIQLKGKVIGEFVCDCIEVIGFSPYNHGEYLCHNDQSFIEQSCLPFDDMFDYIDGGFGYGWHISDLVIYDKPKYINQFHKCGAVSIDDLSYSEELCNYCVDTDYGESRCIGTPNGPIMCEGRFCEGAYKEYLDSYVIKKPPQSWCYVEEVV